MGEESSKTTQTTQKRCGHKQRWRWAAEKTTGLQFSAVKENQDAGLQVMTIGQRDKHKMTQDQIKNPITILQK